LPKLKSELLDDLVKAPDDQPSIGIILCKGKNNVVAECALRDVKTPIGVSSYRVQRELPVELRQALPAPEEFETLLM
jgi:YhcG PDDEXK nuclease domain